MFWIYFFTILLLMLAGLSNASMDVIQFHHGQSIFREWEDRGDWLGRLARSWINPANWRNKDRWFAQNKFLTWLLHGPLVFITDGWHFAQMMMWTSVQVVAALNMPPITGRPWLDILLYVGGMKVIVGAVFELSKEQLLGISKDQARRSFSSWIQRNGVLASQAVLISFFFLSYLVYSLMGGDYQTDRWDAPVWGAMLTVLAGITAFILTRWYASK